MRVPIKLSSLVLSTSLVLEGIALAQSAGVTDLRGVAADEQDAPDNVYNQIERRQLPPLIPHCTVFGARERAKWVAAANGRAEGLYRRI